MQSDAIPAVEDRSGDKEVEALLGSAVAADASAVELDFLTMDGGEATLTTTEGIRMPFLMAESALAGIVRACAQGARTGVRTHH